MNNSLPTGGSNPGGEGHNREGRGQGSSTNSSPRHLLGVSECSEGQQFMHQQQTSLQDDCNTPSGSVYHELQPYTPPSQMFPTPSLSSSTSAMQGSAHQYSSDSCCYGGGNTPRPLPSSFNPHHKQEQQQLQSPPFNAQPGGYFGSNHDPTASYYHQQQEQQQHFQGEQHMMPYFPALASSMNPWAPQADQDQQQPVAESVYPQPLHHPHVYPHGHPYSQHPHSEMENPLSGDHKSPTSFINIVDPAAQGRASSNGSTGSTANTTASTIISNNNGNISSNNAIPPALYPVPQYQSGMALPRQSWPGGPGDCESQSPNSSSSAVMPYHSQHVFPGFSHHLQGQGHPHGHGRSRAMSQWTATGKSKVTVTLYNGDMWAKFHEHTNEMIITKHGRRMFPVLHFMMNGLDPNKLYHVFVDMVVADNSHWKFQGGNWISCGTAEVLPEKGRKYVHPDSPNTGAHWMKQDVNFGKLKLTNNKGSKQKQVILNSMHRYQPQIHIAEDHDGKEGEIILSHAFVDTQFIAVTAYQNTDITQLKIDNNPFAKGFRENFDSRIAVATSMDNDGDLPLTSGGYVQTLHPPVAGPLPMTPQGQMSSLTTPQDPASAYVSGYGYSHHQAHPAPHRMLGAVGAGPSAHQSLVGRSGTVGVPHAQPLALSDHPGGGATAMNAAHSNSTGPFPGIDSHQRQHPPQYMHNFLEQSSPLSSLNDSSGSHHSACALSQQQQQHQASQYHPPSFGNNSPGAGGTFERGHEYNYYQYSQQQHPLQYQYDNNYPSFSAGNSRSDTPAEQPSSCNFGQSINFLEEQERQPDMNYSSCSSDQPPIASGMNSFAGSSAHTLDSCMRGYGAAPAATTVAGRALEPLACASSSPSLTQFSNAESLNSGHLSLNPSSEERLYSAGRGRYSSDGKTPMQSSETQDMAVQNKGTGEISPTSHTAGNEHLGNTTSRHPPSGFFQTENMHCGNGNGGDRRDQRLTQNLASGDACSNDLSSSSFSCSGMTADTIEKPAFLDHQDQRQKWDCRFANFQPQQLQASLPNSNDNTATFPSHHTSPLTTRLTNTTTKSEQQQQQHLGHEYPALQQVPVQSSSDRAVSSPNGFPSTHGSSDLMARDSVIQKSNLPINNDLNGPSLEGNQKPSPPFIFSGSQISPSSSSLQQSQATRADLWVANRSREGGTPTEELGPNSNHEQQQRAKAGSKRKASELKAPGTNSVSAPKKKSTATVPKQDLSGDKTHVAVETTEIVTQQQFHQQLPQVASVSQSSPTSNLPSWHTGKRPSYLQRSSSDADRLSPTEGRNSVPAPNIYPTVMSNAQNTGRTPASGFSSLTSTSAKTGSCKYDDSHFHNAQRSAAHTQNNNFADFRAGSVTRIVNPFDV